MCEMHVENRTIQKNSKYLKLINMIFFKKALKML